MDTTRTVSIKSPRRVSSRQRYRDRVIAVPLSPSLPPAFSRRKCLSLIPDVPSLLFWFPLFACSAHAARLARCCRSRFVILCWRSSPPPRLLLLSKHGVPFRPAPDSSLAEEHGSRRVKKGQ